MSDADDSSEPYLGDSPETEFLARLEQEGIGDSEVMVSALVGPSPSGCSNETGMALPAPRYEAIVEQTGGTSVSICEPDFTGFGQLLGGLSVVLPRSFELSNPPSDDSVVVKIDGISTEAWVLTEAPPAVRFDVAPEAQAEVAVAYTVEVSQ
jgi:hypothetical protein